jgi:hypothetical protein
MEGSQQPVAQVKTAWSRPGGASLPGLKSLGGSVSDVLYIGLIIVVFAALWLLVKGVERFER